MFQLPFWASRNLPAWFLSPNPISSPSAHPKPTLGSGAMLGSSPTKDEVRDLGPNSVCASPSCVKPQTKPDPLWVSFPHLELYDLLHFVTLLPTHPPPHTHTRARLCHCTEKAPSPAPSLRASKKLLAWPCANTANIHTHTHTQLTTTPASSGLGIHTRRSAAKQLSVSKNFHVLTTCPRNPAVNQKDRVPNPRGPLCPGEEDWD